VNEIMRTAELRLAVTHPPELPADIAPAVLFLVDEPADAVQLAPLLHAVRRHADIRPVVVDTGATARRAFADLAELGPARLRPEHRTLELARTDRTSEALRAFGAVLDDETPAVVVVAGASDATLGAALATAKAGLPILRIDGGLRTGDWGQPDEINRTLIDRLSDTLLVSGMTERRALLAEGVSAARVHEVGNLVVDLLERARPRAESRAAWTRAGMRRQGYALAVLERPANLADDERLGAIAAALGALADTTPVLFAVPPGTHAAFRGGGRSEQLHAAGVICVGPLRYLDLLSLKLGALAVITDVLLVGDETTILGRPCFTLAAASERVATLTDGTNVLLGDDPRELAFVDLAADAGAAPDPIPLWDGCSAMRAADILVRNYIFARAAGEVA
jgi:UDP-N-acetylglucosamine 2-epimerase (non-hydrolysing)